MNLPQLFEEAAKMEAKGVRKRRANCSFDVISTHRRERIMERSTIDFRQGSLGWVVQKK